MTMVYRTPSSSSKSESTHKTTPEQGAYRDDEDVWASSSPVESAVQNHSHRETDIMSDLPALRRQHMTDGYREGLSVGKAKVMQQGFDQGYPAGVTIALRAGNVLGVLEGMIAAKDVEHEFRLEIRNVYEQARTELVVSDMLKNISDEEIMGHEGLLIRLGATVSKWEQIVFGRPK